MSGILILLTLFITPYSLATNYKNTKLHNESSIYYEPYGNVRFISAKWQFVTYIDIQKLVSQQPIITEQLLEKVNHSCRQYTSEETCTSLVNIDNLLRKKKFIQEHIVKLQSLINEKLHNFSTCSILGTMNGEDYKNINELIMSASSAPRLISKITNINLHKIHDEIHKMVNKTSTSLQILENVSKTDNSANYYEVKDAVANWIQDLSLETNSYLYHLYSIIDAIQVAKTGSLDKTLLTFEEFQTAVNSFLAHNKNEPYEFQFSNQQLQSEIMLSNMSNINIDIGYYDGKLVVVASALLLSTKVYDLYKMYSYPVLQNFRRIEVFANVEPRADYLIKSGDSYTLAYTEDIDRCHIKNSTYLCQPKYLFYNTTVKPICETTIIIKGAIINDCDIKVSSSLKPYWTQITKGWLYSVPKKEKVEITCDDKFSQVINITGAGILQIKAGCRAYTAYAEIVGQQRVLVELGKDNSQFRLNISAMVPEINYLRFLPKYEQKLNEIKLELTRNYYQMQEKTYDRRKMLIVIIIEFILGLGFLLLLIQSVIRNKVTFVIQEVDV